MAVRQEFEGLLIGRLVGRESALCSAELSTQRFRRGPALQSDCCRAEARRYVANHGTTRKCNERQQETKQAAQDAWRWPRHQSSGRNFRRDSNWPISFTHAARRASSTRSALRQFLCLL